MFGKEEKEDTRRKLKKSWLLHWLIWPHHWSRGQLSIFPVVTVTSSGTKKGKFIKTVFHVQVYLASLNGVRHSEAYIYAQFLVAIF